MLRKPVKERLENYQCELCEKYMESQEMRVHEKLYHSSVVRKIDREDKKKRDSDISKNVRRMQGGTSLCNL